MGWTASALAASKAAVFADWTGSLTIFGGAMLTLGRWDKIVARVKKAEPPAAVGK